MRTFLRAFMLGLSLLSFHLTIFSQQVAKTIPNSTSPDGLIGFLEFRPSDYGTQKHPLIIFLHGIGERGNGTSQINSVAANAIPKFCAAGASMRFTVGGQTSSFVVLSPQLSSQYGYWPTYYIKEMIKYAKANLQIDPNRIYITGLSLGGGGIWRAITEVLNVDFSFDAGIAAAAPVCGTQEESDPDIANCVAANHLPLWAFHSMDDGTVSVNATQHAEILTKAANVTPASKYTYYQSGGHGGAWINAYDTGHITTPVNVNGINTNFTANPNLYEWFLSNSRSITQPNYTVPVANAGATQTITLPLSTITLTGSGSGTNGATISSYSWAKTSGPSGGIISLPLLNTTVVTGLVQGTYVFTLTVTDNHGLSSTANVTIMVNAPIAAALPLPVNQYPAARANADITITLPTSSVNLDGSASYDPDGYIATYWWTQTAGPDGPVMTTRDAETTTVTGLVPGNYTFVLQIKDNGGLEASTSVNITVNAASTSTAPGIGNLLGYIKMSVGYFQSCGDASTSGRMAIYGSSLANGNIVYTDAAQTQIFNGGWNWFSLTSTLGGVTNCALSIFPDGTIHMLNACAGSTIPVAAPPVAAPVPPASNSNLLGYIKMSVGYFQACDDASTSGRMAIYGSSLANGNILYTDAAQAQIFNGGWNWFSLTSTLGGVTNCALSIFPDGTIHMLNACAGSTISAVAPPLAAPAPPASNSNLLGYIKTSVGPYQACDDASSSNRTAVYGTGNIDNGTFLYTDAAMTQNYNGGWNWFSFTPVLGGSVAYAFAVYPDGSIFRLRNCTSGSRVAGTELAAASSMQAITLSAAPVKLNMYPNPVRSSATIELNSLESGAKTINIYNTSGILTAKYTWQTIKGNNTFSLKNISGLAAGLYIAEIRNSNGKPVGKLKFVKQ